VFLGKLFGSVGGSGGRPSYGRTSQPRPSYGPPSSAVNFGAGGLPDFGSIFGQKIGLKRGLLETVLGLKRSILAPILGIKSGLLAPLIGVKTTKLGVVRGILDQKIRLLNGFSGRPQQSGYQKPTYNG
jgi:hypothetical protein